MYNYFSHWGSLLLVHFGAWFSFYFAANIYNGNLQDHNKIPEMVKTAIILALILGLMSSHSHHHYLSHFAK